MASTNHYERGRIVHRRIGVTTTGSAGSAAGNAVVPTDGPAVIRAIKLDYHASAPATTDVLVKAGLDGTTIGTFTNVNTDIAAKNVGAPGGDEANAAIAATDGSAGGWFTPEGVEVEVAQADALTEAVVVDVWFEKIRKIDVRLDPVGSDGSAVVTRTVKLGGAAILRGFAVDFTSQAATTDIVVKAEDSGGTTILTLTNGNTDIAPKALGVPAAIDEANGVTAATDATDGGYPLKSAIYLDVAQADGSADGTKPIVVSLYLDQ